MATTQSADDSTDSEVLEAARKVERTEQFVTVEMERDGSLVRVWSDGIPPLAFDNLVRQHGFMIGRTDDDGRVSVYHSL